MAPEYQQFLSTLDLDPQNQQALAALVRMAGAGGDKGGLAAPPAAAALDEARKTFRDRGEIELCARLFDVELAATTDRARRAELLREKGRLLYDELFVEGEAVECLNRALELDADDAEAQELIANIGLVRENWQRIVKKYLDEARVSTDRQLTTGLYLSIAETFARYKPDSPEVLEHLKKALDVEPRNRRAAAHLERIYRKAERWEELCALLEQRVDAAPSQPERLQALLGLAEVLRAKLAKPQQAGEAMKKVLAIEPAHPRALQTLIDGYTAEENWSALVKVYEGALKSRGSKTVTPADELGLYLQIAMIQWKRLGQMDAAEEHFRRIRKMDPTHAAMVDFYRAYHKDRGEGNKLLGVLQQAHKAEQDAARRAGLALEIASLAESEVGNPEKAIDSWKAILRQDPKNQEARQAIKRLYQKTEKWNALLEILKEEIEAIPNDTPQGKDARVERLLEVVAIYRDRLNLDVMVINTYNNILGLIPDHGQALDALAAKYEQLSRWNDLISVLQRKADAPSTEKATRAALLRRIAGLWTDRFGNQAQAVKPLEELLAVDPTDREAQTKLKDIYIKRRQWRALLELLGKEAEILPEEHKRQHLADMARLASDKLGDGRAAIAIWNRVLELDDKDAEALAALAALYDKEKRWLALSEIYHRQREAIGAEDARAASAILERLGNLYAERLEAPAQAAAAYRDVLKLQPGHAKAIRVLRDLYAQQVDLDSLEELYGSLNAYDDLIEVMHVITDRAQEPEKKLTVLGRIAKLAAEKLKLPEKATKAHERILALDPANLDAARALVPIYTKAEKWARLLSTYEVLLQHARTPADQLALHLEIRKLCEEKLGSKALAFQWCARAYELAPDDEKLLKDLQRLGAEADAWEQVNEILERRVASPQVTDAEKLRLLRELGRIRAQRLHRVDDARGAWEQVLKLAPDDGEAMTALEELASQQARWPDLLTIYRRRAELVKENDKKIELLFKIAFIEEDRAGNPQGAAEVYEQILGLDPKSQRAIRALVKVQGGRGDAAGLARALERELEHATENEARVNLLLRVGALYEDKLTEPKKALERYQTALGLAPQNRNVHAALERFLAPTSTERVAVARLLAPVYERTNDAEAPARLAAALEILRGAEPDAAARLAFDRRLVGLYARKLRDPLNGYEAATRVLHAAPEDVENRKELAQLAGDLSAFDDLALELEKILGLAAPTPAPAPAGATPPAAATTTADPAATATAALGTAAVPAPQNEKLDARLRHDLCAELAEIFDERLQLPPRAETAWRRVLDLDAGDARAYAALERILRDAERWDDLRGILEKRFQNSLDGERRKEILLQICDLYEGVLDSDTGAAEIYRRVLELDPGSMRAYKALERLYDRAQSWRELEDLLAKELAFTRDEREIVGLTFRRAELWAARLEDPARAVDLAEEVLRRDRAHAGARQLLEGLFSRPQLKLRIARLVGPLYAEDGQWADQIRMLQGERELTSHPAEAVELLARIADVQETRLGNEVNAFITWREAVLTDPEDARGRQALERLARSLDRWTEAAETWEQALAQLPAGDVQLKSTLLAEVAAIYDRCLADVEKATLAYKRLIDVDPGNVEQARPAAEALDRLYDEQQQWPELIDILRRQADWAEAPERRTACLVRAAQIQEQKLGDAPAAIQTWRDVLHEEPDNARALDALERLYQTRGDSRDLIDVLTKRADHSKNPTEKRELHGRIANLYERDVKAPGEAIAAYLEILDYLPDDRATLGELARLYRAGERWADLLDIDMRRLAIAESGAEKAQLRFDVGSLMRDKLSRHEEALDYFHQILREDPSHEAALDAVEKMLGDDNLKLQAAEILQPIYDARGDHAKLVELYELEAKAHDDPRERLARLRRVAELRERNLDDSEGAFQAHARAAREALAEPELKDHLAALERLAVQKNKVPALVQLYRDLAPDILDGELQRKMYLDIADRARSTLNDPTLARDYYRRVLDSYPEDARALEALENLYREMNEWSSLREILVRKADLRAEDTDARRDALAEIATLCEDKLDRRDEAVAAWEQVLEMLPADLEATKSLERLYASAERWVDLAELLERRTGYAEDLAEAVDLRYRLGELYEKHLSDPDKAVENYAAAHGGDPHHTGAVAALERFLDDAGVRFGVAEVLEQVYISRQDWPRLIRIAEIRLDATADAETRRALTWKIAGLFEEQLEDLDGAFRWYGKVFREDPGNELVRERLVRLATILEKWDGLANIYQGYLDDESGDPPAVLEVARALGEIFDRRLGDVERARSAWRRVLRAEPDDRETFTKLEGMLTRASRWFALIELYEEGLETALDDTRRKELLLKIAAVQETRLEAIDKAIYAYRGITDLDPDDARALGELERLYQEQNRWSDLAELITNRIDRAGGGGEQAAALRVRLAEVQEHKLDELTSAIEQHEMVVNDASALDTPPWRQALTALERLVIDTEHKSRIAQILEPIYRQQDWWQKLVVILDAQAELTDDKPKRVDMLREIARLHEERGGNLGLALKALARAWREDVSDEGVYTDLERLAAKLNEWDELVATIDAGVEGIYDYDLAARLLARIGRIEEEQRGDRARAIAAWKRVLEVKEDDLDALASLERLYQLDDAAEALVKVLQTKVELIHDVEEKKTLFGRIADLYEHKLDKRDPAIAAWRQVQSLDDRAPQALDALERLFRQAKDYRSLSEVLLQKIELCDAETDKRPLRFTAAAVFDNELHDPFEAISQLKSILDAFPMDTVALEQLDKLFEREKSWADLVEIVDRREKLETDPGVKSDLAYRAARIVEKEQGEQGQAVARYKHLLWELNPAHGATREALDALTLDEDTLEEAADALEPVYAGEGLFDKVAELYERRLAARGLDQDRRRDYVEKLAGVQETGRRDPAAAFAVWARHLKDAPEDSGAQAQLERLAHDRGRWGELTALYESILDGMMDAELGRSYALKLAQSYEEALGDLDKAASRYAKALDFGGDEAGTLAALDRIYERQGKWTELGEILAREATVAMSDEEQATFLFRLGDLRERVLGDPARSVEAYRDVLERVPDHAAARGALERLLGNPAERAAIISILEPLYEREGDFGRLVELMKHKLTVEGSAADRASLLSRMAELAEQKLGDKMLALDSVTRWLGEDPTSEQAAEELERLGRELGRWEEAAACLSDVSQHAGIADVQRELHLRRGRILLEELRDPARAEEAYRKALELDRANGAALAQLETIYRELRDAAKLAEILWRRAEADYDVEKKRAAYAEVGLLRETALSDDEGAVTAWRQVMELSEADLEAHGRLAALYERAGKWEELVEILETAARFAGEKQAEAGLRRRAAEVLAEKLAAPDRAVDAWLAVCDLLPDDDAPLLALAEVHRKRQDWLAVQETLSRRLGLARAVPEKVAIYLELARLAEVERSSPDEAIGYFYQILDEDNASADAYDGLERILSGAERWHDLVDVLGRRAEVHGSLGDKAAEIALLARAADVWEGKLANPDAAGEILEKILAREPGYVPALTRLARIYEAASDWDKCGETLERALALQPSGRDAADLYYRLGRVTEAKGGELAQALPHYERALQFDAAHLDALGAVERGARERGDWAMVAHMVASREAIEAEPAKKLALAIELAEIYRAKLGRAADAIPYLERVAQQAPDDAQVTETLADLYFAAGRTGDAEPHYRKLADKARAARKPKEVARYQQRLGALREAAGDVAEAQKSYEEAYKVDPSHGPTMAGLGRIYFAQSEWEKARRIYRSMLLQNLDPALGVSKADVYLQLGLIHARLGENPKAKSMYERGLELDPQHAGLKEAMAQVK